MNSHTLVYVIRKSAVVFQLFLHRLAMLVSGMALVVMVVTITYLVYARYILRDSPMWGHEIALLCMVWFSLLSPTIAIREDKHITVTMIDLVAPAKVIKALRILAGIVTLSFTLVMFVQGIEIAKLAAGTRMSGTGLSRFVVFVAVPVSGLLMTLMFLARVIGGTSGQSSETAATESGKTVRRQERR